MLHSLYWGRGRVWWSWNCSTFIFGFPKLVWRKGGWRSSTFGTESKFKPFLRLPSRSYPVSLDRNVETTNQSLVKTQPIDLFQIRNSFQLGPDRFTKSLILMYKSLVLVFPMKYGSSDRSSLLAPLYISSLPSPMSNGSMQCLIWKKTPGVLGQQQREIGQGSRFLFKGLGWILDRVCEIVRGECHLGYHKIFCTFCHTLLATLLAYVMPLHV